MKPLKGEVTRRTYLFYLRILAGIDMQSWAFGREMRHGIRCCHLIRMCNFLSLMHCIYRINLYLLVPKSILGEV